LKNLTISSKIDISEIYTSTSSARHSERKVDVILSLSKDK